MSRTAFIVTPCSAASFADVISRGVRRAFATKMAMACAAVRVAPPVSLAFLLCFPSTTAAYASALAAILYVTFLSRTLSFPEYKLAFVKRFNKKTVQ